jgi:2-amino-4-hydroxy-6-hydroxymethyldihydropteridine diphosphokinase
MTRAFVSVGSNIDPAANTLRALRLLGREVRITNISTVYQTDAVGRPGAPPYYNCVVKIETETPPVQLKLEVLRRIEADLGRERTGDKFADRTIDLDLILYDELVMNTEDLALPDPDIAMRPFLAYPLLELTPGLVLPGSARPVNEIAAALSREAMKPLEAYTAEIRKEIIHERKP